MIPRTAQPSVQALFSANGLAASSDGTGQGKARILPDDFDGMAVVVDWLDACRTQRLEQLLETYAVDAGLECVCDGVSIKGRAAIAAYWKPKLTSFEPAAFGIEEISPAGDGVLLHYRNYEGKPVRIRFAFDALGKIAHSCCEPA